MRSFRFLLSRRWVLFFLVVIALSYLAWLLGQWQFHRLEDRKESNAIVRANEDAEPAPVSEVLSPDRAVDDTDEWRLIEATGSYDVDNTIIVRYRTREGGSGVDVVVPLRIPGQPSLLVDRGWLATEAQGTTTVEDVPAPPTGEVDVTGWVRANGTGSSTKVADRSTRAVSSVEIAKELDTELYQGFVELHSEDPEPETSLEPVELPELDNGPHFFYGLQWWFFGVLAVGGFVFFAYDEWKKNKREGDTAGAPPADDDEPAEPVEPTDPAEPGGDATGSVTGTSTSHRPR